MFCFEVSMVLWFDFRVFGKVVKVLKMFVLLFPVFWAFGGLAYSCLFGFGRFRCFCVSCLWFCFANVSFV